MRKENRSLTGLRGVAALYVFVFHFHNNNVSPSTLYGQILLHGYLSVDLFFVLSGFVMAMSYARMFAQLSVRGYVAFLVRRVARVYPLYLVTLCIVTTGLLLGIGDPVDPPSLDSAFALNLLLAQSWGLSYSLILPAWSISTEAGAYLLFPALLAVATRTRPVGAFLVFAVAVASLLALGLVARPATPGLAFYGPLDISWAYSPWPLVRCLVEFTLGLLAFRAAPLVPCPGVVSAFAAAAIVALLAVPGADVALAMLFAALIASLGASVGPVARALASRPVHLLGVLSYAIYLLHFQFLRFERLLPPRLAPHLGKAGAHIATEAIVLGVLLAASAFCNRFIEVPGRAIVRRWARRLDRPLLA